METYVVEKFTALLTEVTTLLPLTRQPARVIPIVPGTAVAWDSCEDGQLTARLASMVPVATTQQQKCGVSYWRATGELTLLRCALSMDDLGRAPSPADLKAEGAESLADTDVMLKAITNQDWVEALVAWVPLGPDGGCKGTQITFTFKLDQPA